MKFIEDRLEGLDDYFSTKKESEKWLIVLGLAVIIAYLGYSYLMPYTENLYKQSEKKKKIIQKSINNHTTYLSSITVNGDKEHYVKKFNSDITVKKEKIIKVKSEITFINSNLEKLSGMLFNQKSWSKFLNSITDKAEVHNIDVQYIENHFVDNNGSFGHVLEVAIGCIGEYKNIVKFMNELEQNVLVTDIFKTELTPDANSTSINSDIHISVWGINH
jgi:hypothetical protein